MIRAVIEELLLFLLPFAGFALWLAFRRRSPLARANWDGNVSWLVIAGLGLAIVGLLATALLTPRKMGAYVPARMENGQLVPGRVE